MKSTSKKAQPLLSLHATAKHCDVSVKTVRRWIQSGELAAYKLGAQWRVSSEELDLFLFLRRKN
jgi:excisionase family DNA binding protein